MRTKFTTADQAVSLVADGATVAVVGAGGGLLEPDGLLEALERRFLGTGHPIGLSIVHTQGIGDGVRTGLNRLAHEGLVRRVIGAHWTWSPRMQRLAAEEKIEAYAVPGGALQHLLRETSAGRPGLITPIGLGTFVDPRQRGGRANRSASQSLTDLAHFDDQEFLRYRPLMIDVAIVRGHGGDAHGNISFVGEGGELDSLVLAMAAHNSGGRVIAQVRAQVATGSLAAACTRLPGALVDAIVEIPEQRLSHAGDLQTPRDWAAHAATAEAGPGISSDTARHIIAARAVRELRDDSIVSFGFGLPDSVAALAASSGKLTRCYRTVDHGHYGGIPLGGSLFGFVLNGDAMIDSPSQFDFYSGGGLDIAILGFGEVDREGNVNVSRLDGKIIGPGGFMEIAQGAHKVVFCGTFTTKGLDVTVKPGGLTVERDGGVRKFVDAVQEITFSGRRAQATGKEVLYVTERAVFRLVENGVELEEVAPGIDVRRDIIEKMGFVPSIPPGGPRAMLGPWT